MRRETLQRPRSVVVRNVNYDGKWTAGEDHIERGEWKPACIGEAAAADVQVFKHMRAGGLGRRDDVSLPGAV